MDVDGKVVPVQRSATLATQELTLSTGWLADGVPGIIRARPSFLLIPVYHKIRVTYAEIRDLIVQFDGYVKGLVKASGNELEGPIEWEIRLTTVEALKRDVRQSNDLEQHRRLAVQLQPMPRFIWRALASIEGEPTLDLLFDATDISQGCAAYIVIEHASDLGDLIRASLANPTTKAAIDPSLIWRVLEVFDT
jgi:hypothetical protein